MNIQSYGNTQSKKRRKAKRYITGICIILFIIFASLFIIGIFTSDSAEYKMRVTAIEENHILREEISELNDEIERLKGELKAKNNVEVPNTEESPVPSQKANQ